MIELYYTGAATFNGIQEDITLSLGGLVSISLVPNDLLGNLFGEVSKGVVENNLRETKIIVIKNVTGAQITAVTAWFNCPDPENVQSKFQIGFLTVSIEATTGDVSVEKLSSSQALPRADAKLQEANGQGNAISLPNIDDTTYLGLVLVKELTDAALVPIDDDTLEDNFDDNVVPSKTESIELVIDWT